MLALEIVRVMAYHFLRQVEVVVVVVVGLKHFESERWVGLVDEVSGPHSL